MSRRKQRESKNQDLFDSIQMLGMLKQMQPNMGESLGFLDALSGLQGKEDQRAFDTRMRPEQLRGATLANNASEQLLPQQVRGATLQNNQIEQLLPFAVQAAASQEPQRLFENSMRTDENSRSQAAEGRAAQLFGPQLEVAKMGKSQIEFDNRMRQSDDTRQNAQEGRNAQLFGPQLKMAEMGPWLTGLEGASREAATKGQTIQNDILGTFGNSSAGLDNAMKAMQIQQMMQEMSMGQFGAPGAPGQAAPDYDVFVQSVLADPATSNETKQAVLAVMQARQQGRVPVSPTRGRPTSSLEVIDQITGNQPPDEISRQFGLMQQASSEGYAPIKPAETGNQAFESLMSALSGGAFAPSKPGEDVPYRIGEKSFDARGNQYDSPSGKDPFADAIAAFLQRLFGK
jgi:hypothetical protein